MGKLRNRDFHLGGTGAARLVVSTGSGVIFSISEECLLFNLGVALISIAKLAATKFATRTVQDRDLQKNVISTGSLGACKCMVPQTPINYLTAEINAFVEDSHLEDVQLIWT